MHQLIRTFHEAPLDTTGQRHVGVGQGDLHGPPHSMSEMAPDHDPAADFVDPLDSPDAGGRAIRGVAVRTSLFGAGLLLNLAAVPFMVRYLGPVDYGYYITVASIVFLVGAVTEAGLTNLGVRHWAAGDSEDRREMIRNLIGLRLSLTLAGLVLATAIAAIAGAPQIIVTGTFVYGLGLLVSMIAYTYAVPLSAQLRLGTTSSLDFLRQALLAIGTLVLGLDRRGADGVLRAVGRRQRDRGRRHGADRARRDLDPPRLRPPPLDRLPAPEHRLLDRRRRRPHLLPRRGHLDLGALDRPRGGLLRRPVPHHRDGGEHPVAVRDLGVPDPRPRRHPRHAAAALRGPARHRGRADRGRLDDARADRGGARPRSR